DLQLTPGGVICALNGCQRFQWTLQCRTIDPDLCLQATVSLDEDVDTAPWRQNAETRIETGNEDAESRHLRIAIIRLRIGLTRLASADGGGIRHLAGYIIDAADYASRTDP